MKTKKQALLHSIVSLLLCVTMLVGTTFAWFTDSVTSGINMIAAGNLDVELYHSNAAVTDERVDSATELFKDLNGNEILWEPGVVSYENLRITNEGDLALTWQMTIATANENFVVDGEDRYGLSQILKVGVVEGGITATDRQSVVDSVADADWTTLADLVRSGSLPESGSSETWGIVIYWQPGDNDNLWNLNNGKQLTSGDTLQIDLGIKLVATQEVYESDSFGNDYDTDAGAFIFHDFVGGTASTNVTLDTDGKTTEEVNITSGSISATVPAGVQVAENATELTLTVTQMTASGANITLNENEDMLSLDVHIDGVADGNTTPITVVLEKAAPVGLNMGNYKLYHVENGQTIAMTEAGENPAHNQFKYDPATGDITLYMATFSEVALVADTENAWNGTFDYDWYDSSASTYTISNADQLAAFGAIVGGIVKNTTTNEYMAPDSFSGKTISLIADINLGDKENANDGLIFHPIGYSYVNGDSTVNAFSGTFDGQGHTIGNFYQNTWEIEGDYDNGYYKDAMGLFGYVSGGTVKNLTVDHFSSDGEFTPTGVIAAYADGNATFQNIAITNCNPRVYNTGNGGIIGVAGNSSGGDNITLSNITVDNSNKISALWGSWDVACGGLVGMFRGNDNGSKISFTNCHVAAQIDVYNDVCANYQYYAYRYAGMIIGSVRNNVEKDGKVLPNMEGITAIGCTVNYGDWNDYYYCELVDNTTASYTHDYQMSRLTKVDVLPDTATGTAHYYVKNDDGTITCRHFIDGVLHTHDKAGTEMLNGETVAVEDKTCVYLPFHQLFTGYGWGVNSVGLEEYSGITVQDFNLDVEEDKEHFAPAVKFGCQFPSAKVDTATGVVTTDFLYRVGTLNEVAVGTLFNALDGLTNPVSGSGVVVSVTSQHDDGINMGSFRAYTKDDDGDGDIEWEKGEITFNQTGIAKITIQDYDYCTPTVLYVEVVEAANAMTATNATANNVVLLNDCGFSSLEVSGGYTLYGNGFTMTCSNDSYAVDRSYGFVVLENGILDNVQIVAPNFSHSILYDSNKTEAEGNVAPVTDSSGRTRYYNIRSAVVMSGNSKITNSYVHGGRAAVYATSGNPVITNSTISGGAAANIHVEPNNNLTLKNVTMIQKPIQANVNTTENTVMGLSVAVICDSDGNGAAITLEGTLQQYAWANEDYSVYVPSDAQSVITEVMKQTAFIHSITYADGVTRDSVNLGFAYLPASTLSYSYANVDDNRTDKETIPYDTASVNSGRVQIYTYKSTSGTSSDVQSEPEYSSNTQGTVLPTVTYSDTNENRVFTTEYSDGWKATLSIDLDAGDYIFSFDNLLVQKYGTDLSYEVTDTDGTAVDTSQTITLSSSATTEFVLTITDDKVYDANGNLTDEVATHTYTFAIVATKTSINPPVINTTSVGTALTVGEKGTSTTWNIAIPALANIKVTYWNGTEYAEGKVLSDLCDVSSLSGTQTTTGENSNIWTYTGSDFTLSITGGLGKTNYYTKPCVVDKTLYFVVDNSEGLCNTSTTSRSITLTYTFTDSNQQSTTKTCTWDHTYNSDDTMYDHSDFLGGELTEVGCITPDTLITLADGTQKEIQYVTYEDNLLAWDFFKGEYAVVPAALIVNHGYGDWTVIKLTFEDGTEVKAIGAHSFFDADTNKWELINEGNAKEYVGHEFVRADGENYAKTKLINVEVYTEYTESYSLVSTCHYNFITENMFSLTNSVHNMLAGLNVGENMVYDIASDVAEFGLYTYENFADYITYEQYTAFNGAYLKISVEKGYITFEEILALIDTYLNN